MINGEAARIGRACLQAIVDGMRMQVPPRSIYRDASVVARKQMPRANGRIGRKQTGNACRPTF